MYKKSVLTILALLMAVLLIGCGSKEAPTPEISETVATESAPEETAPSEPINEESTEEVESLEDLPDLGAIETDEKLLSVEITLPASFLETEDGSPFDVDAYCEKNGFNSAMINEDGSLTVSMTKVRHEEMLQEMAAELDASFAELVEAEDTPYIKEITRSENFDEVIVKVVRADYENAFDMTPFVVGFSSMMYQIFLDMEYHVEILMVDADTGETINSVVYPDDFQE